MKLKAKYQEIWNEALPYLKKCRRWDLAHTKISVDFMYQIIKGEKKESLEDILIPAIILHDIGWSTIGKEKNTSWGKKSLRAKHMKNGAILSSKILEKVNYPKDLITKITKLVSTHDNAYLGVPQVTIEEKLVRDADACFVLTALSFWKDHYVFSKKSPKELLDLQVEKNSKRHTKSAQKITNQQIIDRTNEIKDTSKTPLQRYRELEKTM